MGEKMIKDRNKKILPGNKWVYIISLPCCLFIGWFAALIMQVIGHWRGLSSLAMQVLAYTDSAISILGLACGLAGWLLFFGSYARIAMMRFVDNNAMGSARFATADEINQILAPTEPALPLSEHIRSSIKTPQNRNRNMVIIGASGSGKTFRYIIPTLLSAADNNRAMIDKQGLVSFVITDTNGYNV